MRVDMDEKLDELADKMEKVEGGIVDLAASCYQAGYLAGMRDARDMVARSVGTDAL